MSPVSSRGFWHITLTSSNNARMDLLTTFCNSEQKEYHSQFDLFVKIHFYYISRLQKRSLHCLLNASLT
ncbi:hypothetical protein SAMN04488051_10368 [Alkalimonas amylolytica]|uniref:Uncharacterized protein n=1 Tax=Alkalimonas amylolytica TaxID=152573 RepID=A0A1H4AX98_ALKAM|nr:hypothetical protein SAMN04488051_10368 [Alkalimonas amylolytica]